MISIIDDSNDGFTVRELVRWCQQHISEESEPPNAEKIQEWADRAEGKLEMVVRGYNDVIRGCFLRIDEGHDIKVLQYYSLLLYKCALDSDGVGSDLSKVVLQQVTKDMLFVTRPHYADDKRVDKNDFAIRSVIIPSLMLVIEALLKLGNDWDEAVLAKTAAVLLCFGDDIVNILTPRMYQHDLMQDCVVPMNLSCIIETESIAMDRAYWKDSTTLLLSFSGWKAIAKTLDVSAEEVQLIEVVCQRLEWAKVAKAVRAQFFGKEEEAAVLTSKKPTKLLVYPLKIEGKLPSEPAYRTEPSRTDAVMTFVKATPTPNAVILSEILPVCYTLIDSNLAALVTLGASALTVLLERSENSNDWVDFEDALFSVLEIALKVSSSNAVALSHVCFVCSKACQFLSHRDKERRAFTHRFLELVSFKARNQSDEDGLLRGIVICGVIPLLKQHSHSASAMEIGRFGLTVLLPLLRWDFGISGRKLQVAALIALVNLMVAAYPIMPNHGAKIMSELLATWGHAFRVMPELDDEEKQLCSMSLSLSTHAGAMALLICGDRAKGILDKIKLPTHDIRMVDHVSHVRKACEILRSPKGKTSSCS